MVGVSNQVGDPKSLQKNSSLQTIASLVNQMVGGTMLVLPILFARAGIIAALINMALSGFISAKTNVIYTEHFKPSEVDYEDSVLRILGKTYLMIYRISRFCFLILVAVVYFDMITIQLYNVAIFIFAVSGCSHCYVPQQAKQQFVWDRYSIPYSTLVTLTLCMMLLFCIKDFVLLVKIASYGILSIISYCIFIIYVFATNMSSSDGYREYAKEHPITLFSWDIGSLAGVAALAFTVHVNSASVIRCNRVQANNGRDVAISYLLGGLIYISIGLFGAFGIWGFDPDYCNIQTVSMITDCFPPTSIPNLIVVIIYLSHLISVFPVYCKICRDSFFQLFYSRTKVTERETAVVYCIFLLATIIIINIPGVNPSALMSLNGAVMCFFFVYLIPIALDVICYRGPNKMLNNIKQSFYAVGLVHEQKNQNPSLEIKYQQHYPMAENDNNEKPLKRPLNMLADSSSEYSFADSFTQPPDFSSSAADEHTEYEKEGVTMAEQSCNPHNYIGQDDWRFSTKIALYCFIGLVGVFVLLYEIYSVIDSFVKGDA